MIIGLSPQGLFLLREFSRAGKKVLALAIKDNIGLYSKYGCKITLSKLSDIEDIFLKYLHPNMTIHICSDAFLNYLVDKKHKVFRGFTCFPDYKSAKIFSNKILTGRLARNLRINYPKMYKLKEINTDKWEIYPLILKWNRRRNINEQFKTAIIKSPNDLKNFKAKNHKLNRDLIVQKYIPGEPKVDISYGGYFVDGSEKFYIIIQQERQYPYPNGLASFIKEYMGSHKDEIRKIAKTILEYVGFSGFVEVECRIDIEKDKLYLIEVNPRACGWIKILKRKYRELDLVNLKGNRIEDSDTICWVNLVRDIRSVIDMIKTPAGRKLAKKVITDYQKRPITDIFEFTDLRPFIGQFGKILRKLN
jgi:predicted ATP-grasp superfamily ATP-dependent carboligase